MCPKTAEGGVSEFIHSSKNPTEIRFFFDHLSACPTCKKFYEENRAPTNVSSIRLSQNAEFIRYPKAARVAYIFYCSQNDSHQIIYSHFVAYAMKWEREFY